LRRLIALIGKLINKIRSWCDNKQTEYKKSLLKSCGSNVVIDSGIKIFGYENVTIGNDVYININAVLMTTESEIVIGNHVMLGANVCIVTGDHRSDVIGRYMMDVEDKLDENDLPVIIEDDVWIGSNATILKGVTVGRGSIIGAGSVVVKDVPPYSVCAGNPARVIRMRFTDEEINEHESLLGIGGR